MKRLYISADIEGVCGIADWKETELAEPQGAWFRAEMTREVAAACEAATRAGVEEILVKDAHGSGRNIDPSALPENVRLMRAWTRDPLSMMAGIDSGFGGALFIGYHSAGGSDGNPLAHTMDTTNVGIHINGARASEFHINAWTAARFGVPALLLSGDSLLCSEARALAPGLKTVEVSEGRGNASISINPRLAVRRIGEETAAAVEGAASVAPIVLPERFEVRIQYRLHHLAYRGSFYPGARRVGPAELLFEARDWMEVLTFMHFTL